jgi:ABC-type branched-subunit amino acid transport system substrate-binding protein
MTMRTSMLRLAAVAVTVALVGACSSSSKTSVTGGSATTASAGPKQVKTDTGVTDKEITLGVITDETGVFAALGKNAVQGTQLFWDQQNAAGVVCGR